MSPNIRKNSEQTFYLMTCKHPRTICAKRFSVLSQTIFQSTENDFQICRHPLYGLYRAEHQIKRRRGCFPESILRFSTSHKRFFTRKGSLPSDFFYINVLRWTFCLYILHRDFTGKWYTAYRFRFTNVNRLVINRVMVKGLTRAFSCRIFAGRKQTLNTATMDFKSLFKFYLITS